MHKLFFIDLVLVFFTLCGTFYLYFYSNYSMLFLALIFTSYVISKMIAYKILPYDKFDKFINHLTMESKINSISGFELFKSVLVILLFIGFLFINPMFWFFESILVVIMRIWGYYYTKKLSSLD